MTRGRGFRLECVLVDIRRLAHANLRAQILQVAICQGQTSVVQMSWTKLVLQFDTHAMQPKT
jgi:hypothetical protein